MFRIIAQCDPYNAKKHYHGEEVIRRNGPTPVEWVHEDGFDTKDEACQALMRMARQFGWESWSYEDDESIEELRREIEVEGDNEVSLDWYVGPGVYDMEDGYPVLLEGGDTYTDDSMTYFVEEC